MKGSSNVFRLKIRLHGKDVHDLALESGREYTFGRGTSCDFELEHQPGISREHFKLFEDGGQWNVKVISKFGDINLEGRPVKSAPLEIGSVFKVAGYDFLFADAAIERSTIRSSAVAVDDEMPMASGDSRSNLPATYSQLSAPYEGSDEATRVMDIVQTGDIYLRIVEGSGREETLKLGGRKWVAGREDGSQILLNDRKASRRQFELMASPQGNFVRDLGSSNGTQLNGVPLAADELKPLRSGDVLQVGKLSIHFEVRDPHFEKRLQIVSKDVLNAPMHAQAANPNQQLINYEIINYPVIQGPGGAVRVDSQGQTPAVYEAPQTWDTGADEKKAKAKKFRLLIAMIAIGAAIAYVAMDEEKPVKKAAVAKAAQTGSEEFQRLPPQKQQFVKEAYILGRNLFMQSKQALAAEQFRKIHEILKGGYEDSLALAAECQAQADQEANRRLIEREMQEAAQNKVIVMQNLEKCRPIADRTFEAGELRSCLAPTFERDPSNPLINDFLARVAARNSERDLKLSNQRAYAAKVARGRSLFANAETVESRGDGDAAVEAYQAHLAANMPDPDGLRAKSLKKVGAIKATKASSIASYMQVAETAFVNHDYKTAVSNINKVKGIDPYNTDAAELNGKIQREKDAKLREIYEESVISEGLGQLDNAKLNWKKILEMDHPDGLYYKRAKNKMRAFGGGS